MPAEQYDFQFKIPAGTAQSSPATMDLAMPPRTVRRIEWVVPSGPNGLMGFQIGAAGVAIIPRNAGGWIVANGADSGINLEVPVDSGAWQAFGYNTGAYDHTVYIRFQVDPVDVTGPTYRAPVNL